MRSGYGMGPLMASGVATALRRFWDRGVNTTCGFLVWRADRLASPVARASRPCFPKNTHGREAHATGHNVCPLAYG